MREKKTRTHCFCSGVDNGVPNSITFIYYNKSLLVLSSTKLVVLCTRTREAYIRHARSHNHPLPSGLCHC